MNREHGRNKSAPPKRASHLPQREKKKDRRDSVQEDIGKMMPSRL